MKVLTYSCPKCGDWYWKVWYAYFLNPHVSRHRLHRCPHCKKWTWVKPL